MTIATIINFLETGAHPSLQESYDNAGLLLGDPGTGCQGVLVTLDVTEAVVDEAVRLGCNLIVAHHPLIFSGLKRINGTDPVSRTVIRAIQNDVAVYAIHTNLDNVVGGVSGTMAARLGLVNNRVLDPRPGQLRKLHTFVPMTHLGTVRDALFAAGAGGIGNYDEAGFHVEGTGSFRPLPGARPFVGEPGQRHYESEARLEVTYPAYLEAAVVAALKKAHPYEEVAYGMVALENRMDSIGSGILGEFPSAIRETEALALLKERFGLKALRHTPLTGRPVRKVALCGGAGSFLISKALAAGADLYVTADVKYHEFFAADGRMVIADIGHYESEQFTVDLLFGRLREKFPNFAVLKSGEETNPVQYFI
jgi:dinuclear metal center YbgI/SA1388 family protein